MTSFTFIPSQTGYPTMPYTSYNIKVLNCPNVQPTFRKMLKIWQKLAKESSCGAHTYVSSDLPSCKFRLAERVAMSNYKRPKTPT